MTEHKEYTQLLARMEKVESRLAFLFRSLGINEDEAPEWKPSSRVQELPALGKKNEAIKVFREESGASLKDAKVFIEGIDKKH